MTFFTGQRRMGTRQWELTAIMIKVHVIPTGGIMTDGTILAILSIVGIILLMTRITVLGCAFELIIYMTGCASDFRVLAL